jgi:hypothetical protein
MAAIFLAFGGWIQCFVIMPFGMLTLPAGRMLQGIPGETGG